MSLFFENLPGLVRLGNASVDIFPVQTINNFGNLSAVHPSIEESRKLLPEVIFATCFQISQVASTSLLKMLRHRAC